MTTYCEDIAELRREFGTVDKDDPAQLRRWFQKHSYLTINDHAQIATKGRTYIHSLKKKAGLVGPPPANMPTSKHQKKIVNIEVPDDWDTEAWLRKAVRRYSLGDIAKAVNRSKTAIFDRMKKYGIKERRGNKPANKCYDKEWCLEHYVRRGYTLQQCADLAGICRQTFTNWLNRFQIPVRNFRETQQTLKNVRVWVRKLVEELQQQQTVRKVYIRNDHVHVRFMNYFWETYYVDSRKFKKHRRPFSYSINKEDARIKDVPQVLPEFERSLLSDKEQCHIIINRKQLRKSSLLERRLAVHEFCRQITQRGWIWPEYPDSVLISEWNKVRAYKETKYLRAGGFTIYGSYGRPAPGKRIFEHFFDLSEFAEVFRSPRLTMKILNELLNRNDLAFNVHNMLRIFSSGEVPIPERYPRFRLFDPAAYAVIFKRLGIRGSVLDLKPGFGNRAAACALNGLKYFTIPDDRFRLAMSKGFGEFIGLDYQAYDGQKVDLLLCDNNFEETDITEAFGYLDRAKKMIVFVPNPKYREYQAKYRPESMIKLKTKWYQKQPDYLFVW